jgi:hypothetical protein
MTAERLDSIAGWFAGRLPDGWFVAPPSVTVDGDRVQVVGTLAEPGGPEGASAEYRSGAEAGRIARFREETRRERIRIAREAEERFDVAVTWGAACGGTTLTFTPGTRGAPWRFGRGPGYRGWGPPFRPPFGPWGWRPWWAQAQGRWF